MADVRGVEDAIPTVSGQRDAGPPGPAPAFLPPRTAAGAPEVDDLAMLYLRLDTVGAIRWANETAVRLLRETGSTRVTSATLTSLVHPDEYATVAALLRDAREHRGPVEGVVRLAADGGDGGPRHAHLVLSPAATAGRGREVTGPEMVVQGWDVSSLVLRMRRLQTHAYRDPLTGLANRMTFMDRLRREIARSARSGQVLAVLLADVDGMASVTDGLGHQAGDELLVELARRLTDLLRAGDTIGRLGGAEFAVICPDLAEPDHAMAVADRIRAVAATPLRVNGGAHVCVTMSVGVAFASDPGDPSALATALLLRADAAMYDIRRRRDRTWRAPG
jgi:diguanylate cyclase (GGDEF)-like protein